jgi:hypothetical protein
MQTAVARNEQKGAETDLARRREPTMPLTF